MSKIISRRFKFVAKPVNRKRHEGVIVLKAEFQYVDVLC